MTSLAIATSNTINISLQVKQLSDNFFKCRRSPHLYFFVEFTYLVLNDISHASVIHVIIIMFRHLPIFLKKYTTVYSLHNECSILLTDRWKTT